MDPGSPTPIDTRRVIVDMGIGGTATGSVLFDTTGLTLKTYTVLLQAEIPSGASTQTATLATTSFAVVDRVVPVVDVRVPTESGLVRGSAISSIYARDLHSLIKLVEVNVDGQAWVIAGSTDPSQYLYGRALGALTEGAHTIMARATDAYGNVGTSTLRNFIVDNTAPVIAIQGVTDGSLYNVNVTPLVTVTDANLDIVRTQLNGAAYTSGTPITASGTYQLVVTATDKAGNGTVRSVQFTLDRSGPQITVTGVQDGGLYNVDVVPVIVVTDTGPVTSTITLNGQPFVSGTAVTTSGTYQLAATAVDGAGNRASVALQFTIDKVAPTLIITTPVEGASLTTRFTDVRGTTEAQATVFLTVGTFQVSTVADAQGRFVFTQVPLVEGQNRIQAYARDQVGNNGATAVVNVRVTTSTQAQLEARIVGHGSVLVWLPGTSETHDCNVHGSLGRRDAHSSPPPLHDRYAALSALIETTLLHEEADYLIVRNEEAFVSALRSRRYTTVMFAELHNGGGNGEEDDTTLQMSSLTVLELKAAAASGTGVIWIKTHPDNNEHLQALFGAKPNGSLPNLTQVVLPNSVASVAGTWGIQGFGMKVKLVGGTKVGELKPATQPAMVISQYGDGRTALVMFDPSTISNPQGAMDTVANVLHYAMPVTSASFPGGVVQVEWSASRLLAPLDVELNSQLAAELKFVDVFDGIITLPTTAVWSRHETADHDLFSALVKLPQTSGAFAIAAQLYDKQVGGSTLLAQSTISVTLEQNRDSLGATALAALRDLRVPKNQQAKLQQALDAVQAAITRPQTTKADASYSIDKLTLAFDKLLQIDAVPNAATVAVADLVGAYESLWASYPQ
jgi:hypothetical protein